MYFNVSPQSGKKVNISTINMRPMSQNRERYFAHFSSQNGFLAIHFIESIIYIGTTNPIVEINISDHVNIESEVEFRSY